MAKLKSPGTMKQPRRVSAHHLAPKPMIGKSKKTTFPAQTRTTAKTLTGTKILTPATIAPLQTDPSSDNRVAMLKLRFTGTILKAQQQLFGDRKTRCVEKKHHAVEEPTGAARKATNTSTRCVEKKRPTIVERTGAVPKATNASTRCVGKKQPAIEEQTRVARKVTDTSARCVVKKPTIEELRRGAREALEKVEQSVELDDSHKSVKDLQRLCGCPIPYVGGFRNRMQYYGLYLKT